jgi:hypothetical protein
MREVTHVELSAKMPFHVCNYRENESGRDCRGEAWNDPSEISENQKFPASEQEKRAGQNLVVVIKV